MTRISQQQLESYLWGAATLLRGTIDAGDYKQFIFPLLFYKRLCDVFNEETQAALKESGGDAAFAAYPENHRFQVPQAAHWREVRKAAKNVGTVLQSAMRAIETANPNKLYGIFGDAQWTNKDRLSDAMLRDLVEHFSSLELTVANLPEDELGQGYEYLVKKFADDSGHTAAEFYTNRTVVHLMTEMLEPQPGESIYDPTCGSGGMLLSCITHPQRHAEAIKAMLARHCVYSSQDHLREFLLAQYPNPCLERDHLWRARQRRMLACFAAGADMFSSESHGDSVARQYRDLGLNLRPASMDRNYGWSVLLQRLGDPEAGHKPSLFIHQRCRRLLECLPYLQHDPERPGDILKTNINEDGVGGDDAADALRYLVATKVPHFYVRELRGL